MKKQLAFTAVIGAVLVWAATIAHISGGDQKLTPGELRDLQFLKANVDAGILSEPNIDPNGPYSEPKANPVCGMAVKGRKSPRSEVAQHYAIVCGKKVPHQWLQWTGLSSICSADLVVAVFSGAHTNQTKSWPLLDLTAQGQYTNGFGWGPITKTPQMAARCRTAMVQTFLDCPEALPDQPLLAFSIRCSPSLPDIIPLDQPAPGTNRIQARPSANGTQLMLTNWAPNRTVQIYENASLDSPYWLHVGTVVTGANGTAATNINPVFTTAFYRAKGL